jgi:hypothetical protein
MILWTILDQAALDALNKNGILKGDWRRAIKEFINPYKWMAEQMVRRGIMDEPKSFLWAWHTYGKSKRPDFRTYGFKRQLAYSKVLYRVELDVPDERVLLSDYDLWHSILNGFAVTLNEKEDDKFYPENAERKAYDWIFPSAMPEEDVKKTWERIFDLDIYTSKEADPKWIGSDIQYIQACTPVFKLDWVRKIDKFKSRK